ncbi:NUDIX domain-containing protein [Rhizobium sp. MHM7A]|uniref:NUDIX domain-containing protein n=1 Tax=Rhizobium sp. MHM7A TaxID=2583233 RepID=UPI001105C266|nr:NUDIX domain-containing protein [Rhizobium sp. MHM7A]TLX17075.1 NUDIX domain-containing protein [Rhizobium sp. MHM7A]
MTDVNDITDLESFDRWRAEQLQAMYEWRPFDHAKDITRLLGKIIYAIYSPVYKEGKLVQREEEGLRCLATGRIVGVDEGYAFIKNFRDNLRPYPDEIVYHNPKPVIVVMMRAPSGAVLTRRAEERTRGQLAFPAGFQENKDLTWQNAARREVFEETGLVISPEYLKEYKTHTVANGSINLMFAFYMRLVDEPPKREPDDEVLEVVTTARPIDLAFETHTEALRAFLTLDVSLFKQVQASDEDLTL